MGRQPHLVNSYADQRDANRHAVFRLGRTVDVSGVSRIGPDLAESAAAIAAGELQDSILGALPFVRRILGEANTE